MLSWLAAARISSHGWPLAAFFDSVGRNIEGKVEVEPTRSAVREARIPSQELERRARF